MGHGTQADTFLARDEKGPPGEERVVVVKQLHLGRRTGGGWKPFELFEREVRALQTLRHPGIPRFLASFESEPGVFNLVMERAPGATLWAYRKKVRFDDDQLRDILIAALDILAYMHGLNPPVVHRDIKPSNLVRSAKGHISLIDFGGVRDALRADGGSTVIGTFGYMAPEQLHGQASPATDLYGLGATIIALAGDVEPEKVPRVGLRMDLDAHLPRMEPRLRATLAAMVAPDPDDRPARAADALAMLQRPPARAALVPPPRDARPSAGAMTAPGATHEIVARVVDEIAEFTSELPPPLRVVMRTLVFLLGLTGYLGLTLIRLAILPVGFAVASSIAGREREARVAEVQRSVEGAVDDARAGMRAITRGRRRPELPAPAGAAGLSKRARRELRARRRRERRR